MDTTALQRRRRMAAADLLETRRDQVIAPTMAELRRQENRVVLDAGARRLFLDHIGACLDDVLLDLREGAHPGSGLGHPLSRDIGWVRAAQGIHPDESIYASQVFFERASATFLDALTEAGYADDIGPVLLSILHRNVIERIVTATVRYMDYLLANIQQAHGDERRRLSREIHDRVANGISTVYRRLEICEFQLSLPQQRAAASVAPTRAAFVETLAAIQDIDQRLQTLVVVRESLDRSVRDYYEDVDPPKPRLCLLVDGDEAWLPPAARTEIFLIVREAIRNVLRHGHAATLEIRVHLSPQEALCIVADDGVGFDPATARDAPGHSGLLSMQERAAGLGGVFTLVSEPGQGTRILVAIPLGSG